MPKMSRRTLVAASLAAPALIATGVFVAPVRAATAVAPPPVARRKVGRFTVTVLTDGYLDVPYSTWVGIEGADLEAMARAGHAHRAHGGMRLSLSTWIVDDGDRKVLIDAGPGVFAETTGRLPGAMAAIGIAPEEIDAVAITHMHFDHIGGLLDGDRARFPNAELYIDRRDVSFFTDPAEENAAPDFRKVSFRTSAKVVAAYKSLQQIDGEREILKGLSSVDLTGHTPGHIGWRIADAGDSLTIVGDMLFNPVIHPVRLDVGVAFEPNADAAMRMRRSFIPQAAEEGGLLAATHMPFPGLGRIVRDGDSYAWLPAEWDFDA
ncbi:MBL fold metallo-hydrolase [Ruegeria profundi]|uniref:Metallo-beta-lactamase domain-containing protein n=1 Tax=Ruegeria profundi TaxID=1685378 RepID=A0A0X3U059_9RHOB|nr:MBL fold metallo-hydrolase [Ruegeria profundi]KUJ81443.1 hypothetical protein AVO44_05880 [Ruegeria profundi]